MVRLATWARQLLQPLYDMTTDFFLTYSNMFVCCDTWTMCHFRSMYESVQKIESMSRHVRDVSAFFGADMTEQRKR